jgi:hypothetical protein
MNTTPIDRMPSWFWAAALLGLAWNVFGVVQFLATAQGTIGSLMRSGLTQQQAQLYLNLPIWMTSSFAIGVFAGALGSILLLLRNKAAVTVFAISLAAYVMLYIGDITQGVFAVFGAKQVIILTTVVLIATALLWLALHLRRRSAMK